MSLALPSTNKYEYYRLQYLSAIKRVLELTMGYTVPSPCYVSHCVTKWGQDKSQHPLKGHWPHLAESSPWQVTGMAHQSKSCLQGEQAQVSTVHFSSTAYQKQKSQVVLPWSGPPKWGNRKISFEGLVWFLRSERRPPVFWLVHPLKYFHNFI